LDVGSEVDDAVEGVFLCIGNDLKKDCGCDVGFSDLPFELVGRDDVSLLSAFLPGAVRGRAGSFSGGRRIGFNIGCDELSEDGILTGSGKLRDISPGRLVGGEALVGLFFAASEDDQE
jgi:hypothetical protein